MTKNQKFSFLRTIGDYLERHVDGIDLTVVDDYENEQDGGIVHIYWFTDEAKTEVDVVRYHIDLTGQIVGLPVALEEWLKVAPAVRAFIRAFNHIAYQTLAAVGYADGLIEKEEVKHG